VRLLFAIAGLCALALAEASAARAQDLDDDDGEAPAATTPAAPAAPAGTATPAAPAVERAEGLGEPRPGIRPRRRRRAPVEDPGPPWRGPRVELGWAHYSLADGHGGGSVHAFSFGGYLPTKRARLGGWAELGSRNYALGQNDLLVRAVAAAGYQHLVDYSIWLPYVVVTASMGGLFGKRFHTTQTDFIYGLGLEAGLDINLVRSLFFGLSFGYSRLAYGGVADHVFELRLRLGL
jgi:hypothetical protein